MTLSEFLTKHTKVLELCAIRIDGWVKFTCWIDYEDIWEIPSEYADKIVKNDVWGELEIATPDKTADGKIKTATIPCHYIDI